MKPVMLMILDGWGIAPAGPYNAAKTAKTPELSRLFETYPHTRLLGADAYYQSLRRRHAAAKQSFA